MLWGAILQGTLIFGNGYLFRALCNPFLIRCALKERDSVPDGAYKGYSVEGSDHACPTLLVRSLWGKILLGGSRHF